MKQRRICSPTWCSVWSSCSTTPAPVCPVREEAAEHAVVAAADSEAYSKDDSDQVRA